MLWSACSLFLSPQMKQKKKFIDFKVYECIGNSEVTKPLENGSHNRETWLTMCHSCKQAVWNGLLRPFAKSEFPATIAANIVRL